jgi:hypothetical protein
MRLLVGLLLSAVAGALATADFNVDRGPFVAKCKAAYIARGGPGTKRVTYHKNAAIHQHQDGSRRLHKMG